MNDQGPSLAKIVGAAAGAISIAAGIVSALLGCAAVMISHMRTGMEVLGVITVVVIQWMIAGVGGYMLGGAAAAEGNPIGRIGKLLNFASVLITLLVLVHYYTVVRK